MARRTLAPLHSPAALIETPRRQVPRSARSTGNGAARPGSRRPARRKARRCRDRALRTRPSKMRFHSLILNHAVISRLLVLRRAAARFPVRDPGHHREGLFSSANLTNSASSSRHRPECEAASPSFDSFSGRSERGPSSAFDRRCGWPARSPTLPKTAFLRPRQARRRPRAAERSASTIDRQSRGPRIGGPERGPGPPSVSRRDLEAFHRCAA